MILRYRKLLLLSIFALLTAGCGQTYSPYLTLPKAPLYAGEFQVVAGVGGMPVANEVFPGVSAGEMALVRYGITDRFTMQAQTWTDALPSLRPIGFSLEGIELLSERTSPWRLAVIPRFGIMNSGIELNGWGGSLTLASWTPNLLGGHPYLGLGAVAGTGRENGNSFATGFGANANAGIEYDLFDHLSLNAESSWPVLIIRSSAGHYYTNGFWVLGVAAGYHF